ncbi:MAG TPA: response regulator [Isosphaeraceae bacterium]|jgi:CheY-like chemotaxis protein|nr:response regulator [Isosphaeraceae bacterium]
MHSDSETPLVLVIDDSATIRKLVECHLTQAGYRVASVADAERGLKLAESIRPQLILLDHQLPGTTGDDVCRRLLETEATAHVPVVISSAMRNRAFARYTEFPNVVDQIPKPFTPELLKSGVANALQTGAMVVQAQRTGCSMPEAVSDLGECTLEGSTAAFPARAVIDFLNNSLQTGRLTLEMGRDRIGIALAGGRIQAVFSPTWTPERLEEWLPPELADLAPLMLVTLGERQDAPMSGLVRLLERSLSDPRRVRALLRFQAGVLAYLVMTGEPGRFGFDPRGGLPPMFQAFPLQLSLPALLVEGTRRCAPRPNLAEWANVILARHSQRGGNLDRAGLSPAEVRMHALLDGTNTLAAVAQGAGIDLAEAALVARGLELAGLLERRQGAAHGSILVLEDDPESARLMQRVLGPEGTGYELKVVRDRVGAQLLLRRGKYDVVMMALDQAEQEPFYRACRTQAPAGTKFVGILRLDAGCPLARVDALGLDGVLHRPVAEADLLATIKHLMTAVQTAADPIG